MLNPLQNAPHDSNVIESLANERLDKARPVVASVQHPWNIQLPMVHWIAGTVWIGADEEGTAEDEDEIAL